MTPTLEELVKKEFCTIIVVDGNPTISNSIARDLRSEGYKIIHITNPIAARIPRWNDIQQGNLENKWCAEFLAELLTDIVQEHEFNVIIRNYTDQQQQKTLYHICGQISKTTLADLSTIFYSKYDREQVLTQIRIGHAIRVLRYGYDSFIEKLEENYCDPTGNIVFCLRAILEQAEKLHQNPEIISDLKPILEKTFHEVCAKRAKYARTNRDVWLDLAQKTLHGYSKVLFKTEFPEPKKLPSPVIDTIEEAFTWTSYEAARDQYCKANHDVEKIEIKYENKGKSCNAKFLIQQDTKTFLISAIIAPLTYVTTTGKKYNFEIYPNLSNEAIEPEKIKETIEKCRAEDETVIQVTDLTESTNLDQKFKWAVFNYLCTKHSNF